MKIKVQSKSGKIWDVKPENIGEVYRRGGRLVNEDQKIKVQSKDGRVWNVKVKNIQEVIRRGGSILEDQDLGFIDRAKQFGSGALSGITRAGLSEGADQFGAGVMEVAPGVVAPILPESAQVMAESAKKGLEALESMRPDEDDALGNVLYKAGEFTGATASMPFPGGGGAINVGKFVLPPAISGGLNYGKSLASGAIAGGIAGGLNQYYDVPEPIADLTGIALGNTRIAPTVKLGIQGASDLKIPFASGYNKKIDTKKAERQVSSLVKDLTKEKDLERLNNFKADGLDVVPVTAEVALNKDISNLHNVYSPNSSVVLNKQKQNDAILRGKLDKIGIENYSPTVEEVGSEGRNFFTTEVDKLKKIRKEESAPYYQAQLESQNLYPVTNFETAINQGIADNVGDLEKMLQRYSRILPDKNAALLKRLRAERAGLQKKNRISSKKSEIDINKLSPAAREQLMLENPDLQKITDIEAKITALEGSKYRPAHIDSTIKNMRNEALDLPVGSEKRTFLNRYADELEKDLEATETGAKARHKYKEHSPKINEVEQDEFLNTFIEKKKTGNFKVPVEKLPGGLLSAPFDSVRRYGTWTKGSRTEDLTKAYLRDKYLGKAVDIEGGLPTPNKSSGFLKHQRPRVEAILNRNEMSELDRVNQYLKDRDTVMQGNKSHGSATNARRMLDEITARYIGNPTVKKNPSIAYIPVLNKIFKSAAEATKPSPKYDVLYDFLTDPVYAQKVLKRQKGISLRDLKPTHKGYIPQTLQAISDED
jgi:hypothetical protein